MAKLCNVRKRDYWGKPLGTVEMRAEPFNDSLSLECADDSGMWFELLINGRDLETLAKAIKNTMSEEEWGDL